MDICYTGNFFAQAYYPPEYNKMLCSGASTSRNCLLDYAAYIRLDDLET
jgi:hypothetical protein